MAVSTPTTVLTFEPVSASGRPSSSPMIGKVLNAESMTRSWKSGLPWRMKPKMVDCPVPPGDDGGRSRRGYVLSAIEKAWADEVAEREGDEWES